MKCTNCNVKFLRNGNGWSPGGWGSVGFDSDDTREFDLTLGYATGGLDWTAEVGATPWATTFYDANGFAVTNVSLGASKNLSVNEKYALPISLTATWNPRTEDAFFTAGVTF